MNVIAFSQQSIINPEDLVTAGISTTERSFISVGGGIGSFCWVDCLRVHGIKAQDIAIISPSTIPYQQFKEYCDASSLSPEDRLRSDSSSRPDNFWGFPGYAVSEIFDNVRHGQFIAALTIAAQILVEPILTDFYTPKAGQVYRSINREMARINWQTMVLPGTAAFLRKTTDGRYVVFYTTITGQQAAVIAQTVHLSLGHTLKNQPYRQSSASGRITSVYHPHDLIFQSIEQHGGRIAIIGRGIAAARIVERLLQHKKPVEIVSVFQTSGEPIIDHRQIKLQQLAGWRLQAFNWPRAAFGGAIMEQIKKSYNRSVLTGPWSVSTTPPRRRWIKGVIQALEQGSYKQVIGKIESLTNQPDRVTVKGDQWQFDCHYVIDCTGFEQNATAHAFYQDLIATYAVDQTPSGTIKVTEAFEIPSLINVFVTGTAAAGNSYGPVDSFMGHHFAATQMINRLAESMVKKLSILSSTIQWLKWSFTIAL